jgi:fructosamine-3-kinase
MPQTSASHASADSWLVLMLMWFNVNNIYNLYHVLNHFNLFGTGYLGQARRMIDKLRSELG